MTRSTRLLGALLVALCSSIMALWHSAQAAEFACAAGDVACLIAAINAANANGEANTITLAAGTYTLTAVKNSTDQPNGLPVISSTLTIMGVGADTTIIERAADAPAFRLVAVVLRGTLTLKGLTLRGGLVPSSLTGSQGGGLHNAGTLMITDSTLADNAASFGGGIQILAS